MKPALLSLAVLLAATAAAGTYTYQFTGVIDLINSNENNAIPDVVTDQSFTGWFSYDSSTKGAMAFTLGAFQPAVINDSCFVVVYNDPPATPSGCDSFSAMYYDTQGQYTFERTGITLKDTTCTAFSSTQLPTDLVLSMFTSARLDIAGHKGTDDFNISGKITSLTQVPEPACLLLVLCGTLCLRRRK